MAKRRRRATRRSTGGLFSGLYRFFFADLEQAERNQQRAYDERRRREEKLGIRPEKVRERAEARAARAAARQARKHVRSEERQSLLGQRMRLQAFRKGESQSAAERRHDASLEHRARKASERASRIPGGRSKFLAAGTPPRSYQDVFGDDNPRRKKHRRGPQKRRRR